MIACSALIAGLICYIVYIKKLKDKYKTSDEVDKIAEVEQRKGEPDGQIKP